MINPITADESFQVLAFVCVPLLLLLVAAIIIRNCLTPRSTATFPTFSVTISSVGREEAYAMYRDKNEHIEFGARIGRGRKFFVPQIYVEVPQKMPNDAVREVIPNLAFGLEKLGYEYLIYRMREPQVVPAEEREAAFLQLCQMGFEAEVSSDQEKIQRALVHNWRSKMMVPQLLSLIKTARGIRRNSEVLARSDSAVDRIQL